MSRARPAEEAAAASPLDPIGLVCARAAVIALVIGVGEGLAVSNVIGTSVAGIGLANAGLWFPIALVSLLPGLLLRRLDDPRVRRGLAFALGVALAAAILFARFSTTGSSVLRAAPAEAIAAVGLGWAAMELRLEDPLRRPVAIAGLIVAAALQVYATRWVDAHRAFAGLLAQHTAAPRFMLRVVLRRFV